MKEGQSFYQYIGDETSPMKIGSIIRDAEARRDTHTIMYVYSLNKRVVEFIETFLRLGYTDITAAGGETRVRQFKYVIGRGGVAIKLFARCSCGARITIFNFSLIIRGKKYDLRKSYGHSHLVDNMQDAIEQLQAFGAVDKPTIGSASMAIYRNMVKDEFNYQFKFPNSIYKIDPEPWMRHCQNIADFCRMSYMGGWNYCNPEFTQKHIEEGITYDNNGLYPYVLTAFKYPVGKPVASWKGERPKYLDGMESRYSFYMIKAMFHVKPDKFPFLKIRNDVSVRNNKLVVATVKPAVLVLTETDWELFNECYEIERLEHIGGIAFQAEPGEKLFGNYIHTFADIKANNTGVIRFTAKMFLNNLGGKFGSSTDSTHYLYKPEHPGMLDVVFENERRGSYIPVASAMTAYARRVTIKSALANKDRFIYSDTDSIHLNGKEPPIGLDIDPVRLGAWKIEEEWKDGYYTGLKVYSQTITNGTVEYAEDNDDDVYVTNINYVNAGLTDPEKIEVIKIATESGLSPAEHIKKIRDRLNNPEAKEARKKAFYEAIGQHRFGIDLNS